MNKGEQVLEMAKLGRENSQHKTTPISVFLLYYEWQYH